MNYCTFRIIRPSRRYAFSYWRSWDRKSAFTGFPPPDRRQGKRTNCNAESHWGMLRHENALSAADADVPTGRSSANAQQLHFAASAAPLTLQERSSAPTSRSDPPAASAPPPHNERLHHGCRRRCVRSPSPGRLTPDSQRFCRKGIFYPQIRPNHVSPHRYTRPCSVPAPARAGSRSVTECPSMLLIPAGARPWTSELFPTSPGGGIAVAVAAGIWSSSWGSVNCDATGAGALRVRNV